MNEHRVDNPLGIPAAAEAIERFCKLQMQVNTFVFDHEHAADCFCGQGGFWRDGAVDPDGYRNELRAVEWIENVVRERLAELVAGEEAAGV